MGTIQSRRHKKKAKKKSCNADPKIPKGERVNSDITTLQLLKKLWKQVSVLTGAMLWVCSNNRLQQKSCFLYIPTQSIYTMWRMIIFTGRRESKTGYHWRTEERSFLSPHFRVSSCMPLARLLFTISPKWRAFSQATQKGTSQLKYLVYWVQFVLVWGLGGEHIPFFTPGFTDK